MGNHCITIGNVVKARPYLPDGLCFGSAGIAPFLPSGVSVPFFLSQSFSLGLGSLGKGGLGLVGLGKSGLSRTVHPALFLDTCLFGRSLRSLRITIGLFGTVPFCVCNRSQPLLLLSLPLTPDFFRFDLPSLLIRSFLRLPRLLLCSQARGVLFLPLKALGFQPVSLYLCCPQLPQFLAR